MAQKRKAVQFGPPGKLWFAPTPAQPENVQAPAAQEYPRLQKTEAPPSDQPAQAVAQRFQVKGK